MATFLNETCETGGVKPTDPLLFTCEISKAALLRVILPTGDHEVISVGDTAADVALPAGFTAVSLDITEIDATRINYKLTLSVDNASLLEGGEIICDDTTSRYVAKAGCPIGKLHQTVHSCVYPDYVVEPNPCTDIIYTAYCLVVYMPGFLQHCVLVMCVVLMYCYI